VRSRFFTAPLLPPLIILYPSSLPPVLYLHSESSDSSDTGNSTHVPGNSTDSDDSKSSKSEKSNKSEKSEKSTKAPSVKSAKSPTTSTKSQKSTKSPTESSKKSKDTPSSDDNDDMTPAPTPDDSNAFTAQSVWQTELDDTVATGQLFYDPQSNFGWYTYTADRTVQRPALESRSSSTTTTTTTFGIKQAENDDNDDDDEAAIETLARFCAIDVSNGQVMSPCQEIPPTIDSASSTEIQSVQACTDENGAVMSFAVIVHDSVKFLQFTNVLGARLIVYPVDGAEEPVVMEYEGWTSLYADPSISGRPAFSPDCDKVYATWVTDPKTGGKSTTTVAISVSASENRRELWRLDMADNYRRFVGWTPSSDGNTLFSATNMPEEIRGTEEATEAMGQMGMVQVDAATGEILQEFFFDDDVFHNAYTNVVLDDGGNTYHVDSAFGLIKFDGPSLDKGPVWQSATTMSTISIRRLHSIRMHPSRALRPKQIWFEGSGEGGDDRLPNAIYTPAMAYQPAFDTSNYETVFGSDGAHTQLRDNVAALSTAQGNSVWQTSVAEGKDPDASNVITDDIKWAPSSAASDGYGVYVASGPVVQAYDSKSGALLWKYAIDDARRRRRVEEADEVKNDSRTTENLDTLVSRMEIVDSQSVLVAADGLILRLQTVQDGTPTLAPGPTASPSSSSPTRSPTPSPTREDADQPSTPAPSSAFTRNMTLRISMFVGSLFYAVVSTCLM
jgi:PQQ-like domain